MGAFVRRILAFLLGFVMSFVTVVGGVGVGAYWAYKNLSIDKVTDDPVISPVVDKMSVEDFVADLQQYMSDPNSYTLGEIEEKYGLDLSSAFGDFAQGLSPEYKNIQFLALFTGDSEVLLESINLKVVVSALEKILPEGMLSERAKEQLGKSTMLDLVKEGDTAVKINKLLGKLTVGDILGFMYEDVSEGNIEPDYELKADIKSSVSNEGIQMLASVLGNVEISALVRAMSDQYDNDLLDEIMAFGLTEIGDIDVGEFIAAFIPEGVELPVNFKTMFGGKTIRSLISGELHEYKLEPLSLLSGITVADIMGYTVDAETGIVTDSKGEVVEGVLRDLATLNVGDLIVALITSSGSNAGSTGITIDKVLDYILGEDNALNNLTVGSIFETVLGVKKNDSGEWTDKNGAPLEGAMASLSSLFDLNVMETVRMFTDGDFTLAKLAEYFDGKTLGDFIAPFTELEKNAEGKWVDAAGNEPIGVDAILAGVMDITVSGLIGGVDSIITSSDIVPLLDEIMAGTLGNTEIGTMLSYVKGADGNWEDASGETVAPAFNKILSINLKELEDTLVIVDENGNRVFNPDIFEVIDYLLSDINTNDVLSTFAPEVYEKIADAVNGITNVENLLKVSFADMIKAIAGVESEEISNLLKEITVNDVTTAIKEILLAFGVKDDATVPQMLSLEPASRVKASGIDTFDVIFAILDEIGSDSLIGNEKIFDIGGIKDRVVSEITIDSYIDSVKNVLTGLEVVDTKVEALVNDLKKYVDDYTAATISQFNYKAIEIDEIIDSVEKVFNLFIDDMDTVNAFLDIARALFKSDATLGNIEIDIRTVGGIVRFAKDVADAAMPESFAQKQKICDALSILAEICDQLCVGYIPNVKFNKEGELFTVVNYVNDLICVFVDTDGVGTAITGAVDNLYGSTTFENLKRKTLALKVHRVIDEFFGVISNAGIVSATFTEAIAEVVKTAFTDEATIGKIEYRELVVSDITEGLRSTIQRFENDSEAKDYLGVLGSHTDTIYTALNAIDNLELAGNTKKFGEISLDSLSEAGNIKVKSVTTALKNIFSTINLNGYNEAVERSIEIIANVFAEDATFNNIQLTEMTVGFVTDEVNEIIGVLESQNLLNALGDYVVTLKTAINEISKLLDSNAPEETKLTEINVEEITYHAVINAVESILLTVNVVSDETVSGVAELARIIIKDNKVVKFQLDGNARFTEIIDATLNVIETVIYNGESTIETEQPVVYECITLVKDIFKNLTIGNASEQFVKSLKDIEIIPTAKEIVSIIYQGEEETKAPAWLNTTLGTLEELYGNTTVRGFVNATKKLNIRSVKNGGAIEKLGVIDAVMIVADSIVKIDGEVYDAIVEALELIFAENATIGNVRFNDVTVGLVADEVRNIVDLIKQKNIGIDATLRKKIFEVIESVEELLGRDTRLTQLGSKLAKLPVFSTEDVTGNVISAGVIDTVIDIVDQFNKVPANVKNSIVSLFECVLDKEQNPRLNNFWTKINKTSTVGEVYETTFKAIKVFTGFTMGKTAEDGVDIFLNIYKDVRINPSYIGNDFLKATKTIVIASKVQEILTYVKKNFVSSLKADYEVFDLIAGVTVGDILGETSVDPVGAIQKNLENKAKAENVEVLTVVNNAVSDLLFNKKFNKTETYEQVIIYGIYAVAGVTVYIVAPEVIHDAIADDMTLNDVVSASAITSDKELQSLITKLFNFNVEDILYVIEGASSIEFVKTVVDDVRIGDVVAAFTKVTEESDAWTYGNETFDAIIEEILTISFDEFILIAQGNVKFEDVFGYNVITVGEAEEFVYDVFGVLAEEGVKVPTFVRTAIGVVSELIGGQNKALYVQNASVKEITYHNVINGVEEIVITVNGISVKAVSGVAELARIIVKDNKLAKFQFNANAKFTEIVDSLMTVAEGIVYNGSANTFETDKPAVYKTAKLLKDIFESVTIGNANKEAVKCLKDIKVAPTVKEIVSIIYNGNEATKAPAWLNTTVDTLEGLYGDTTVRLFVSETKKLNIRSVKNGGTIEKLGVIDAVMNIVSSAAKIDGEVSDAIVDALDLIFTETATVGKVKFNQITVGLVADEVRNIVDLIKQKNIGIDATLRKKIFEVIESVEELLGRDTLVTKLGQKVVNLPLFSTAETIGVIDTVLDIVSQYVKVSANVRNSIVLLFETALEAEATVSNFWNKFKAVTVGMISAEINNVAEIINKASVSEKVSLTTAEIEKLLGRESKLNEIKVGELKVSAVIDSVKAIAQIYVNAKGDEVAEAVGEAAKYVFAADVKLNGIKVNGSATYNGANEKIWAVITSITNKRESEVYPAGVAKVVEYVKANFGGIEIAKTKSEGKTAVENLAVTGISELVIDVMYGSKVPSVVSEAQSSLESIYGTTVIKELVGATKEINVHKLVSEVLDVVNAATENKKALDLAAELADVVKLVVADDSTLASWKLNQVSTVNDAYNSANDIASIATGKTEVVTGKLKNLVDVVLGIYGEAKLANVKADAVASTKAIKIASTLKALCEAVAIRSEYAFYDLLKDGETEITVGDFVDNASATVKKITGKITGIGYLNDIVSDLYFNQKFAEISTFKKVAVYGTYAVAGVVAYVVDKEAVRNEIGDRTIASVVSVDSIGKNEEQKALLNEVFDFKFITVLDVIEGKTTITEAAKTLVENVSIGDIVAAFSGVTESATVWTYGEEEFGKLATDVFNVQLTEFVEYFAKEKSGSEIFDYRNITVGNAEELLIDVVGVLKVKTGKNLTSVVQVLNSVGKLLGREVLVQNVSLNNIRLHAIVEEAGDIVTSIKPESTKLAGMVVEVEDLLKLVINDVTVTESGKLNRNVTLGELYVQTTAIVAELGKKIKDGSALDVVMTFVTDNFGSIKLGNVRTEAVVAVKDIGTRDLTALVADVATTVAASKASVIAKAKDAIDLVISDVTVGQIVSREQSIINGSAKVVEIFDAAIAIVDTYKGGSVISAGTWMAVTVDFAKEVFADVTLKNVVVDAKAAIAGVKIHAIGDFVETLTATVISNVTVNRMVKATNSAIKNFFTAEATLVNRQTQNISISAINDAIANIAYGKNMAELLAGDRTDKVKALSIYYIDLNAGAVVYMLNRDKVTDLLGDRTIDKELSVAGKTPAISANIKNVKLNDILRVSVDKLTGKVDKNGLMSVDEFLEVYFNGSTVGDVIGVFVESLSERISDNAIVKAICDVTIADLYAAARGGMGKLELVKKTLDQITLGEATGISDIKINGNSVRLYEYVKGIELNDMISVVLPRVKENSTYALLGVGEIIIKYFTVFGGHIDAAMGDATLGDAVNAVLPDSIKNNVLVKAVLGITVNDVYNVLRKYVTYNEVLVRALGTITVGDVLGYTKDASGVLYKDGVAKFVYSPNADTLVLTDSVKYIACGLINDVMGMKLGKFVAANYLESIKNGSVSFGELFDRTLVGGQWIDGNGNAAITLWNAIYSLNVQSLIGSLKDSILNSLGDEMIGELFFDITYNGNGWIYNPNGSALFNGGSLFNKIEANLFKMKVNELLVGGSLNVDAIMNVAFEGIYLGDALGYSIATVETVSATATETFGTIVDAYGELPVGTYTVSNADNTYYVQASADEFYFAVENEAGTYEKKTISVTDQRKLEYGEYIGVYAVGNLQYVWMNGTEQASTVYGLLANTNLGSVMNAGGGMGGISLIDDIEWLAIADIAPSLGAGNKVINLINNVPLKKIESKLNAISLGELMGYTLVEVTDITGYSDTAIASVKTNATDYVRFVGEKWYKANDTLATRKGAAATASDYLLEMTDGTDAVSMLKSMFGSMTIGDITGGNGIDSVINNINYMTLKEILGEGNDLFNTANNKIFGKLGDTQINKLSEKLNSIYVGELMGYTQGTQVGTTDYKWYKNAEMTIPVKGFEEVMANLTIGGLDSDLNTKIQNIKLKDIIIVDSDSILSVVISDTTTVGNAATEIQNNIKTLTIGQMMQFGIINISGVEENKFDVALGTGWKNYTMDAFVKAILNYIE